MTSARIANLAWVACTSLLAVACVETESPPNIPLQTEIAYGDRIYLVDFSQQTPTGNVCTRFGVPVVGTSSVIAPVEGFGTGQIDITEPHNCFVPVQPKTLTVDRIEVTNDLFQLCVDSDVCRRPDPSDASKSQVCSDEDDFERCPVVDVPREEASRLCAFIGRRLPTMVEHIAIRQAGFVNPANPQPDQMAPFITGTNNEPNGCGDALLNTPVCNATRPSPVGSAEDPNGSAVNDVITLNNGSIFDLTGSQTEWSSDGFTTSRGPATGLPWFCIAPLVQQDPPTCPVLPGSTNETAPCIYGDYQPPGLPYGTYPICITTNNAAFSGQIGALSGGGIQDLTADARTVGVFSRRTSDDPEGDDGTERSFGFRCVDDRPSADENGDLQPFNTVEVDTTFSPL